MSRHIWAASHGAGTGLASAPGRSRAFEALARLNLDITSARVATFGERAVDVFYVTDLTGQKVINTNRQSAIRRHLLAVFEPAQKAA